MNFQEAVKQILGEVGGVLRQVSAADAERLVEAVLAARRIYVTGEGRSGLVARTFAMRLVHLGMAACVCGETTTPAIESGDLCLACSGSGETMITLHRAEQSRRVGARVAAIVAAVGSTLGAEADVEVVLPAPTKLSAGEAASRQFGASLFEQALLLFLDALVLRLQERRGASPESMSTKHSNLE
jgi:6-phospho-3-hexuloisomerase